MRKSFYAASAIALQAVGVAALTPQGASASDITFAVIGPHEYELPVNYEPFNVLVQYNEFNSTRRYYDDGGDLVRGPRQNLFVGLTKFVHFTTFDAMPNVGWAFEVIVPEVHVGLKNAKDLNGIGDPIIGFATWIKPTPNSTLGFQSFLQPPVGTKEVTNNWWSNLSSILFDVQFPKASFTGNVGVVLRGDRNGPGPDVDPGDSFHTNLRLGYKLDNPNLPLEPFLSLDYQANSASHFRGSKVDGTKGHDLAIGGGINYAFSKKYSAAVMYTHSIDGRNVAGTNAVYVKLAWAPFP